MRYYFSQLVIFLEFTQKGKNTEAIASNLAAEHFSLQYRKLYAGKKCKVIIMCQKKQLT